MPSSRPSFSPERILFVEDEADVAGPIKRGLEEEGYRVSWTTEGEEGLTEALAVSYDVLIVDWRLPGMDGRTLVERLRSEGNATPLLMLTALQDVDHRVAGLDAGADDYLTKPFSFEELLARLRALTRRADRQAESPDTQTTHLQAGALTMDTARRTVRYGPSSLDLRPKAFRLLELLLRQKGTVVTRTTIAERVWGSPYDVTANAIDVTVSSLRQALQDVGLTGDALSRVSIETARGIGYRLTVSPSSKDLSSSDHSA
ncbi:two-component system OmpR family response regulator [Salinibacter ruber]|jgi:DNA-binding response OmpR family regulator|uniref:response regulator transcription factor n=1 Tax=Salinibacter ruber TaxID=146919 RepID=UPI00216749B1|nr:response regulator transcription factor [Salinibacter ruber]MCS3936990.1 two-component system OmpR family response regulator [Salinibacter ruber]MCS4047613.1 two-component system OmpR family response regulator [Salinibacter ruber]MCS4178606.1 two-component system OmpR family response regulator [Salinibacter ruber]